MSLSRVKTWGNEVLTAGDLNGEFNNILNNPTSLISPATANWDLASHTLIDAVFKNTPVSFASADATPSVAGGTVFKTANVVPTTISFFDDGVAGQRIWVVINDSNTTVDFTGTNLAGNAGADWSPSSGDILHAVFISPKWYCTLSTSSVSTGTWTPSPGGTSVCSAQFGTYIKLGRLVHINCSMIVTTLGTGSTTLIHNLPFAGGTSPTLDQALSVGWADTLATAVVSVNAQVSGASTDIHLYGRTAASTTMATPNILGDGSNIQLTGVYRTD